LAGGGSDSRWTRGWLWWKLRAMFNRGVWMRMAAAVASGLLVAALFPPLAFGLLVWVALVPLLVALWSGEGRLGLRRGFGLGFLAGWVTFLVQFHWLAVVSPLGVVVLPLYLGLFWGVFGAFAATLGNPWKARGTAANTAASVAVLPPSARGPLPEVRASLRLAACNAAVWAGLEWLRGWLFTGFGWNGLGVAFQDTPTIAQAADLFGVAGLSMVPVFFQAAVVQTGRRVLDGLRAGVRRTRIDAIAAAVVVAMVACYGIFRMSLEAGRASVRLKTMLVQINIPQDAARPLWDPVEVHMAYEEETLRAFDELGKEDRQGGQAAPKRPDWVMWPESALTGRILRADDGAWATWRENEDTIARVRAAGDFQLLHGVNEIEAVDDGLGGLEMKEGARVWNSLAVMSADKRLQTYRKHHLVIFGETIPFVDSVPLLKKIYEQQAGVEYGGSFTPGDSFEPLRIPTADGTVIGGVPSVCFEDTVPRLVRRFVRPGPQVIVNVTNDGWFKESAAAAQHFANARFRAIELRRPMLRCANTGVSAAIDSTGSTAHPDTGSPQVLTDAVGSHFTRGSLLAELDVPLEPSFSLYAVAGDWPLIGWSLAGAGWAWATRRRPMPGHAGGGPGGPVVDRRGRARGIPASKAGTFERPGEGGEKPGRRKAVPSAPPDLF
jgi:apolipoprotein N-acyltransferase